MISSRFHTWIAGTLELSSKVRYGMSSRGIPLFRFVPYDRRFAPMAVGCSQRNLFYNVHAIVEPTEQGRGSLVQNLGTPTKESELAVLLATYAYDSRKDLRPSKVAPDIPNTFSSNETRLSFAPDCTFAIDPPGCRDADDTVSFKAQEDGSWQVAIHIADVSAWIPEGHPLDKEAKERATSFYSPTGQVLCPMFPSSFSEDKASLLPGQFKPTFSLLFRWSPGQAPTEFQWRETFTQPSTSYTYEEAQTNADTEPLLQALRDLTNDLGGNPDDSHSWIASLMILYNRQAGILLKKHRLGLLRKHAAPTAEKLAAFAELAEYVPALLHFAQESAEYCLASEENTRHVGLGEDAYAYASSPLRRYADLVNQRCLKQILYPPQAPPSNTNSTELAEALNRRQKQAKALQRDLFFLTNMDNSTESSVKGIVLQHNLEKQSISVYVPDWQRIVKVRSLVFEPPALGSPVSLDWFDNRSLARWKERIVFRATLVN